MVRPLLFLDVDGPLIPFGAADYPLFPPLPDRHEHPLLARLDPALGVRLAALPGELVWATTWFTDANDVIAPRLGLPPLPVVDEPHQADFADLHWKTRPLVTWAAGRPFAWVDDEISAADRAWVAAQHPGAALLHRVDPRTGLTEADFATLAEWLENPIENPAENP
ncbi:HAD domain-containing protein [Amycolatopsis rhabdoformis]|uniref:HAD domain-containing protein n=1 Tax=Amycolatopsis rhabdoformis TaxID=1448059 RepID=A0ABZ1I849_9PSEU|nr:HAD domain-containing protein [Amycolatopsis rhabdoformis]WSE30384.1 HAD domain-containing protein [Amycolatopsis rhabdoformis]